MGIPHSTPSAPSRSASLSRASFGLIPRRFRSTYVYFLTRYIAESVRMLLKKWDALSVKAQSDASGGKMKGYAVVSFAQLFTTHTKLLTLIFFFRLSSSTGSTRSRSSTCTAPPLELSHDLTPCSSVSLGTSPSDPLSACSSMMPRTLSPSPPPLARSSTPRPSRSSTSAASSRPPKAVFLPGSAPTPSTSTRGSPGGRAPSPTWPECVRPPLSSAHQSDRGPSLRSQGTGSTPGSRRGQATARTFSPTSRPPRMPMETRCPSLSSPPRVCVRDVAARPHLLTLALGSHSPHTADRWK